MNRAITWDRDFTLDDSSDSYRQLVIGQLRLWEGKIARLNADLAQLEDDTRLNYENRLRHLQHCNRTVFALFGAYLLAEDSQWDMKRRELDAAITYMQQMLDQFTVQPVWSGLGAAGSSK